MNEADVNQQPDQNQSSDHQTDQTPVTSTIPPEDLQDGGKDKAPLLPPVTAQCVEAPLPNEPIITNG